MRKALVINCSTSKTRYFYNLGARKLADWKSLQEQKDICKYYNRCS